MEDGIRNVESWVDIVLGRLRLGRRRGSGLSAFELALLLGRDPRIFLSHVVGMGND